MQYRDELVLAADEIYTSMENKRAKILNQIQMHAVSQIKEGYTGFRISKLKKEDERYLREWAEMTKATIKVISFRCFENAKRYIIRQFVVDLKDCVKLDYELEGKALIIEI